MKELPKGGLIGKTAQLVRSAMKMNIPLRAA